MKTGTVFKTYNAKDGRKVILRTLQMEDLDDILEFINSLAEEDLDVLPERRILNKEEESGWLMHRIAEIEKGKVIDIVAVIGDKVIANSEVKRKGRSMNHVGEIGISIRSGYRNIGIGTEMMKTLVNESRKLGLKVLVLHVFKNPRAKHVYEKVGFKETGRIPKGFFRKGKYLDDIIMTLNLNQT